MRAESRMRHPCRRRLRRTHGERPRGKLRRRLQLFRTGAYICLVQLDGIFTAFLNIEKVIKTKLKGW
jgi:hypothetical protein